MSNTRCTRGISPSSRSAVGRTGLRLWPRGNVSRGDTSSGRTGRCCLAASRLLAATAIVYLPVVFADFAWDDQGQILANADNLRLSRIPAFFLTDVWSMTEQENIVRPPYYRPLFMTSLTVDHVLFGLSAWGYHLHSLLWHLAAVVALLVLLKQVLPPIP